jgi:hypothetical protein
MAKKIRYFIFLCIMIVLLCSYVDSTETPEFNETTFKPDTIFTIKSSVYLIGIDKDHTRCAILCGTYTVDGNECIHVNDILKYVKTTWYKVTIMDITSLAEGIHCSKIRYIYIY